MAEKETEVKNFKEIKEQSKAKRWANRNYAIEKLQEKGVKFTKHNNDFHLIISVENSFLNELPLDIVIIDFWPSTGLYKVRFTEISGRGLFNLLKFIGK